MAYAERLLAPNEQVMYKAKFFWMEYVWASVLCFLIIGIFILIRLLTTEMVVTNKRVIYKVGWIARKTEEIHVNRVEELNLKQSILGRILGYGSIFMRGTGGSSIMFKNIASPAKFQQSLIQATTG